ncbi:hypothetical protein ATN37_25610 [Rhodococcus sp. MH15]|nr:hypothetical protein [Rhodococcus sp. MH15]
MATLSFGAGADHFYLDRIGQRQLVEILRSVPTLIAGLDVAVGKQEKFGSGGPRVGRVEQAQPLPFNPRVSDAATALHHELATWVRFVCEPRGIWYWPEGCTHSARFIGPLRERETRAPVHFSPPSTLELAEWLDRNVAALALTPGGEEALDAIRNVVVAGFATLRPPREEVIPQLDEDAVNEARDYEMHRHAIAKAARGLGEDYAGLTAERVNTLRRAKKIFGTRCIVATRAELFRFGDVLDAHLEHKSRSRSKEAA